MTGHLTRQLPVVNTQKAPANAGACKMAGQRKEKSRYEDKEKKAKLRWPKFIILDFLSAVRKFCVNKFGLNSWVNLKLGLKLP